MSSRHHPGQHNVSPPREPVAIDETNSVPQAADDSPSDPAPQADSIEAT